MLVSVIITIIKLYQLMECKPHSCTEPQRGGLEVWYGVRQQRYCHKAQRRILCFPDPSAAQALWVSVMLKT